jgi:hypothetical protein
MRAASVKPRFGQPSVDRNSDKPDRYKWVALSNTTVGILMATVDSSIMMISLPAIFRGIGLNPLVASNTGYLLWLLMSYMVVTVTAVLVVSFGRMVTCSGA